MSAPTKILEWAGTPAGSSTLGKAQNCGRAFYEDIDDGSFQNLIKVRFGSYIHRLVAHHHYCVEAGVGARTKRLVESGFDTWRQFTDWDRPQVDWDNILHPREKRLAGDLKLSEMRELQAKRVARQVITLLRERVQVAAVEVPMTSDSEVTVHVGQRGEEQTEEVKLPLTCSADLLGRMQGEKVMIDLKTTHVRGAAESALWLMNALPSMQVAIQSIVTRERGAKLYHLVVPLNNFELHDAPYFVPVVAPRVEEYLLETGISTPWKVPRYACNYCEAVVQCWGAK